MRQSRTAYMRQYQRMTREESPAARYQRRKRRRGLCLVGGCDAAHVDGYRCARHRDANRRAKRAWYARNAARYRAARNAEVAAKKALGLCGVAGCERPRQVVLGRMRWACRDHLLKAAAYQAARYRRSA